MAWDIAATSAMKHECLVKGPQHAGDGFRGAQRGVERGCRGCGGDARAEAGGGVGGEKAEACELVVAQRLSIALQRENARAVLRRVAHAGGGDGGGVGDEQEGRGWCEQAAEGWDEDVAGGEGMSSEGKQAGPGLGAAGPDAHDLELCGLGALHIRGRGWLVVC